MKQCRDCKVHKDTQDFCRNRGSLDGLCNYCRECHRRRNAEYKRTSGGKAAQRIHNRRYCRTDVGRLANQQKSRRRRERKNDLEFKLTPADIEIIRERFSNQCFNCGSEKRLEIDHHYPLNAGFGLRLDNAVLLCKACNSAKKDKMPEGFYSEDQLLILNEILF